jgi:hypothetical protein
MKELQLYILKKLVIGVWCILASVNPIVLYAQDEEDSVSMYSDSAVAVDSDTDSNEIEKESSDEVVLRSVPDSTVERMKREKAFAYANDPAYWIKQKRVYRKGFWDYVFEFFTSSEIRFIFYTLLVGLAIFVLYRIIVVNELLVFKGSKNSRRLSEEPGTAEADRNTVDAKIQEAIDQKNFQMAVRYLFLKTLYLLNDKDWIQFHPEATNNQYLSQMSGHEQNKDFRFLTRVYEYIWYGKFDITEQQFSLVHDSFKNFHAAL